MIVSSIVLTIKQKGGIMDWEKYSKDKDFCVYWENSPELKACKDDDFVAGGGAGEVLVASWAFGYKYAYKEMARAKELQAELDNLNLQVKIVQDALDANQR